MFNPKEWIDSAPKNEDAAIEVAGKKIKIRAMVGSGWEHFIRADQNAKENPMAVESVTAIVLHHGVINEKTGGKFTYEEMLAFHNACPEAADVIAAEILRITMAIHDEEQKAIEAAEKNFAKTGMPPHSVDGVATTDKTPEQPASNGAS